MLKWSLLANLAAASSYIDFEMTPYQDVLGTGVGESEGQTGSSGYAQVVQLQVGGQMMRMVIDTKGNEILVISSKCKTCAVGINQEKWDQDDESNKEYIVGEPGDEINQEFNYLSNLHYKDTFVQGRYYETQVCVEGDLNCGNNFQIFVVDEANPPMDMPYEGVIGFGLWEAIGDKKSNNSLTQLVEQNYIASASFGVYTGTDSSTLSSQIRLGGSNERLFASGWTEPIWFETTGKNEWTIEVQQLRFWNIGYDQFNVEVLINPGYEYIAAPMSDWIKFREDLEAKYDDVTCQEYQCYINDHSCENIHSDIGYLQLFIDAQHSYEIPSTSYVKSGYNNLTDENICWIKVIGQPTPAIDYWILGGSFLTNHYISYDASDSDQPKIGLTPPSKNAMSTVESVSDPTDELEPVNNPSLDADSWASSSYEAPGYSGATAIFLSLTSTLALSSVL